eukprot:53072-Eustigmatos_ZCMA.PRE.1
MAGLLEQKMMRSRVPHFSGDDDKWFEFKPKMIAHLDEKKLLKTLLSERPVGDGREEWEDKCRQIYNQLILHLHREPLCLVMQYQEPRTSGDLMMDGVAAWKELVDKYEPKGNIGKMALLEEFDTITLGDTQDPDPVYIKLETARRRLLAMGEQISESTMMHKFIKRLPPTYDGIQHILRYDDALTWPVAKQK